MLKTWWGSNQQPQNFSTMVCHLITALRRERQNLMIIDQFIHYLRNRVPRYNNYQNMLPTYHKTPVVKPNKSIIFYFENNVDPDH